MSSFFSSTRTVRTGVDDTWMRTWFFLSGTVEESKRGKRTRYLCVRRETTRTIGSVLDSWTVLCSKL